MNGLSGSTIGNGLPMGGTSTNTRYAGADQSGDNTQTKVIGAISTSSVSRDASGLDNGTAAIQAVRPAVASNTLVTTANITPATARTAGHVGDFSQDHHQTMSEHAVAEPAATRLFFDSLIASMTTGVAITKIAESVKLATSAEKTPAEQTDKSADIARSRFLQGLKLVNEPV